MKTVLTAVKYFYRLSCSVLYYRAGNLTGKRSAKIMHTRRPSEKALENLYTHMKRIPLSYLEDTVNMNKCLSVYIALENKAAALLAHTFSPWQKLPVIPLEVPR